MLDNEQIKLEQEILGAIFKNNNLLINAAEKVKPEMFLYKPHAKIYIAIIDMVNNKMAVDLVSFLEYYKGVISEMDGITYITEIYSCSTSEIGFNTKITLLIRAYKKQIYLQMRNVLNGDMSLEELEAEVESAKVKVHKCEIKKEIDITKQYEDYMQWLYDDDRDFGMKCGFVNLDKILGNFQKGRLITIFARSGVGKTTFSLQVAMNIALNGHNVFYGSSEMASSQVFSKMAGNKLSLNSKAIIENRINDEEKAKICDYMAKLLENNFYISTETDLEKFIKEIKVYNLQHSLDIIFVDYVNKYIDYGDKDILTNKLGKVSGMLKKLAEEENICVVLVAQANRTVDKRTSDMAIERIDASDIQDSARIEQDSDQVIALYRNIKFDDKLYKHTMFKKGKIDYNSRDATKNPECINAVVLKNRWGEIGTCALKWEGRFSRISDM